jgi:hypothetical protein
MLEKARTRFRSAARKLTRACSSHSRAEPLLGVRALPQKRRIQMADMTPSVLANAIMAKIEANASFRALTAAPVDARDLFVSDSSAGS